MSVKVEITGNVGQTPELAYAPSGTAYLRMSVAGQLDYDKETKTSTTQWFNVTLFGALAENAASLIEKGTTVKVVGYLKSLKQSDKGDGKVWADVTGNELSLPVKSYAAKTE